MKKIIMLALVLTTITGTAFSRNSDAINEKVLSSFTNSFHKAEDVRWELKKGLYKATFKIDGQVMFAYYKENGEQVALTRNIHTAQLPLNLASDLSNNYGEFWLTDLFEVVANGETAYYATVENSTRITILKADGASRWYVFKREKRK